MTTNMELAGQVGEGDGAAAAGEAWVSRRPESAVVLAENFLHFLFQPFLPIFRAKMEDVLRPIRATFSRNFKHTKKAFGRLSKIFFILVLKMRRSGFKTACTTS